MTRDHAKKLLPVIQAFAEGKVIEVDNGMGWAGGYEDLNFLSPPECYRIKPEPKVMYVNVYENCLAAHFTRADSDEAATSKRIACVRVEYTEGQFDE